MEVNLQLQVMGRGTKVNMDPLAVHAFVQDMPEAEPDRWWHTVCSPAIKSHTDTEKLNCETASIL